MWRGEWRPVIAMIDSNNHPTTLVSRAIKVVLHVEAERWMSPHYHVAILVNPGEVVERFDRDPSARVWEYI